MEVSKTLKSILKRLRLSGILATLCDRVTYAKKAKLDPMAFLELVLQDEVDRREQGSLARRLDRAGFEEEWTLEAFDWDAPITFDRDRVRDLFGLSFIDEHQDVILMGPVGVGKTFLAGALGHSACRSGRNTLFLRADKMLRELHQARADHSTERVMRRLLAPDVLIVDDFGLRRLDQQQSSDLYEVILERHKRASTILTSNRTVDEWIALFDDPILAQSAIDRLAHNAHQVIIEGESYRERQGPGTDSKPKRARKKATRPRRRSR